MVEAQSTTENAKYLEQASNSPSSIIVPDLLITPENLNDSLLIILSLHKNMNKMKQKMAVKLTVELTKSFMTAWTILLIMTRTMLEQDRVLIWMMGILSSVTWILKKIIKVVVNSPGIKLSTNTALKIQITHSQET
jgi:hypothetical protein